MRKESDEETFDYQAHPYGVTISGPFVEEWRTEVDGYHVPNLTAHPAPVNGTVRWSLTLDHRFGIECTDEELRRWLPFIANAMAVAAGYSSFGKHSRKINPYKVRVFNITTDDTTEP